MDELAAEEENLNRNTRGQEPEVAAEPKVVGYAEGEEVGEGVRPLNHHHKKQNVGEVIPNVVYSQNHNVRKNQPELDGRMDNFENPYGRQQPQQQPQYQPPPYQMPYPQGRIVKRAAAPAPAAQAATMVNEIKESTDNLPHFGIHRLVSTGEKKKSKLWLF